MIIVETKKAIEDFKQFGKELSGKQLALSLSRAINRSLMQGRTVARKAVSSEYNISQRNLSAIDLKRSTADTLRGEIRADGKPIPLTAFSPKYETPSRSISTTRRGQQKVKDRSRKKKNPGKGVSIEIHSGKREVLPFAFMTPKITAVFARGKYISKGFEKRNIREAKTGNDLPIQSMLSVSVHTTVINPASQAAISTKVNIVLPQQLKHEVEYRLSKIKPKSVPS